MLLSPCQVSQQSDEHQQRHQGLRGPCTTLPQARAAEGPTSGRSRLSQTHCERTKATGQALLGCSAYARCPTGLMSASSHIRVSVTAHACLKAG